MPKFSVKECGGGVVKDIPPHELAPNQWSDALNVRFANGLAERRGGIKAAWTTPLITPYAIATFIKTDGTRFVVYAGLTKVYADDGSTQTEITRYTDGAVISSITRVGTTATLTTATAHGLSTGNTVTVYGALPAAYNRTASITVTGATTFTYSMLSDPGSSATTVGQYSYDVTSNFTGAIADRPTIFTFNGLCIFNFPADGAYYWNGDTSTRLRRVPGLPSTRFYAMGAFKNYLIGLRPTVSGTESPHFIQWSESAETGALPTTWTAANTNDAGDTPQAAETGGFIVDGQTMGDEFFIFKDDGRFALTFVGSPAVMSLRRLPGREGLLARGCAVETPKGQVFLANGDLMVHQGGAAQSIVEGVNRRWLLSRIDGSNASRSFLAVNHAKCEVWVVFTALNDTYPTAVLSWNWNDGTQGIHTIPAAICGCTGLIAGGVDSDTWASDSDTWIGDNTAWYSSQYGLNEQRLILGLSGPYLGLADTGNYDLGAAITWTLEKTGTTFDDTDSLKVVKGTRPQISATAGMAFSVYHATTMQASDTVTYGTVVTYTTGTSEWANRFSKAGRFLAMKFTGSAEAGFSLKSYDVDFALQGKF